jgi:hypothetical protein
MMTSNPTIFVRSVERIQHSAFCSCIALKEGIFEYNPQSTKTSWLCAFPCLSHISSGDVTFEPPNISRGFGNWRGITCGEGCWHRVGAVFGSDPSTSPPPDPDLGLVVGGGGRCDCGVPSPADHFTRSCDDTVKSPMLWKQIKRDKRDFVIDLNVYAGVEKRQIFPRRREAI